MLSEDLQQKRADSFVKYLDTMLRLLEAAKEPSDAAASIAQTLGVFITKSFESESMQDLVDKYGDVLKTMKKGLGHDLDKLD